jgi:anion-transporting  ArsA/GET3 family ATPase
VTSPGEPAAGASSLGEVVGERSVIVCCGPGGVGKTTVSASLALEAARRARRACVVTVDPARRLADALGVESLPNTPTEVAGPWPGELHAVMLDPKTTFDELVDHYARTEDQAAAIKANRLYQNLTGALSGTQEYMAMEKLFELTGSGAYDVVVVDTPPTRNALDLLDAPRRLTQFLENRLFRALMAPTRLSLRAINLATQALLKTISRVAGAEIVQDAIAFFQAFQGMEVGFDERASAMRALLADPSTAYVIVTSPRADAIEEAWFFADRLAERHVAPAGLVVNRVHPRFAPDVPHGGSIGTAGAPAGSVLAAIVANLVELDQIASEEEAAFAGLVARLAPAPVACVELLGSDVHDVAGLGAVADDLFGGAGAAAPRVAVAAAGAAAPRARGRPQPQGAAGGRNGDRTSEGAGAADDGGGAGEPPDARG